LPGRLRHRAASMIAACWGTHGLLWGTHGVQLGHASMRIGAQGGARRGTRLDGCARPPCVGARAAAKARKECSGYSTDRRGCSSGTDADVHHVERALVNRTRPRAGIICGRRCRTTDVYRRARMQHVLRDSECACSDPDHPSANKGADSGAVAQPGWYCAAWRGFACVRTAVAMPSVARVYARMMVCGMHTVLR
jgi:hypothetical protein